MNDNETIRGYRVLGDRPKSDKLYSVNDLHLSAHAAKAERALAKKIKKKGANCVGREDEFTPPNSSDLPSDDEAQLMCAGCPAKTECKVYLQLARHTFGVWAGEVRGRSLPDD